MYFCIFFFSCLFFLAAFYFPLTEHEHSEYEWASISIDTKRRRWSFSRWSSDIAQRNKRRWRQQIASEKMSAEKMALYFAWLCVCAVEKRWKKKNEKRRRQVKVRCRSAETQCQLRVHVRSMMYNKQSRKMILLLLVKTARAYKGN